MMMDEQFYSIVLSCIPGLGEITARHLIKAMGSAQAVFEKKEELRDKILPKNRNIIDMLDCPEAFQRAEKEIIFNEKHQIQCLTMKDEGYPARLRECDDAPFVLFYRGNADLNTLKVIAMVGTRRATQYGHDICDRFIKELSEQIQNVLIVSGLAYGIDVFSHRAALDNGYNTVCVLAHGLDMIYPNVHRATAAKMISQGGLLTEYMTKSIPDKQHFVKRNRIVAGISDATIVVESAFKGGALITADIAESYHRDVFAFPGKIFDEFSTGCNHLIRENKAALITSAKDFIKAMGWDEHEKKPPIIQRQLFPDLSEQEQHIVEKLQNTPEGMQINTLVIETNIPVNQISVHLFELEMKGVIRTLAGGVYQLV
ncbi:DNA-processing protein DprA [Phocaeicola oris]|uniref:DNA-processing protein DprA n=1 Tax=Phocaeicola oris TaxID=2896850 RepID=UPI00234F0706|nr:DNA-processing protein DprA [Phocaeicola oris]MCE2616124.1 DNA-processing protein DprA [Phocaeicola oris]